VRPPRRSHLGVAQRRARGTSPYLAGLFRLVVHELRSNRCLALFIQESTDSGGSGLEQSRERTCRPTLQADVAGARDMMSDWRRVRQRAATSAPCRSCPDLRAPRRKPTPAPLCHVPVPVPAGQAGGPAAVGPGFDWTVPRPGAFSGPDARPPAPSLGWSGSSPPSPQTVPLTSPLGLACGTETRTQRNRFRYARSLPILSERAQPTLASSGGAAGGWPRGGRLRHMGPLARGHQNRAPLHRSHRNPGTPRAAVSRGRNAQHLFIGSGIGLYTTAEGTRTGLKRGIAPCRLRRVYCSASERNFGLRLDYKTRRAAACRPSPRIRAMTHCPPSPQKAANAGYLCCGLRCSCFARCCHAS